MMNTHLLFRADATSEIGAGHVMRCIALAQRWKAMRGRAIFLSYCESADLRRRIVSEGFEYVPIDSQKPSHKELPIIIDTLEKVRSSIEQDPWVVLDGYLFSTNYHTKVKETGLKLLVIDDYNHLSFYDADIIVNQNLKNGTYRYKCHSDAVKLMGTQYALIRDEFLKYKDFNREFPEKARRILVTMGGSDNDNNTVKVLRATKMFKDPDLEIKVVAGASNPNITSVRQSVASKSINCKLIESVNDMASLMAWADLAVTAGGSTCWELCFMGVPSIVVCVADNQRETSRNMGKMNGGLVFDANSLSEPRGLVKAFEELIFNREMRRDISFKMRDEIDGYGSQRIIDSMKMRSNESTASWS